MDSLQALFLQYLERKIGEKEPSLGLYLGDFLIQENTSLCTSFFSFVAEQTGRFPSFEQWEHFLKTEYKAPKKPEPEDPFLYQNAEYFGREDLEAKTYRAYIFTSKLEKWQAENHQATKNEERKRRIKACYSTDPVGYCRYVIDRLPEAEQEFLQRPQPFLIPETARQKHSYINGGTGSGKSELMKTLIHHDLTKNKNTALVLIDPHGKLAQEVAQFKENTSGERLVLIAPDLDRTQSPVFNPFDIGKGLDAIGLDIAVQELIGAFKEILQDIGFTPQMETLLKPCIATVLLYPNGNLYHLQQMMEEGESTELLAFAQEYLPNPYQRNFLKTDFLKSSYAPSRQSVRTKLQSLLNSQLFLNFTVGQSTFSLSQSIAERKLIIFSLSRNTGAETSDTMGRFILASLQSLAMQRANLSTEALENVPAIHLFIDECQHYVTPSIETILTETRKYKLYLTLANQFLDQIDSKRIRSAIKGNTALKITGRQTEPDTLAIISKTTGIDPDTIRNLNTGQYQAKTGILEAIKIEGITHTLGNKNAIDKEEWEVLKAQQIAKFYQKTTCSQEVQVVDKVEKRRKLN